MTELEQRDVTFATIEDLYLARGGVRSGESDFGVMWSSGPRRGRSRTPTYRVTVVHDTGDVYAEAISSLPASWPRAIVLGTLPHDCGRRDLATIQTHGAGCAYTVGERALDGWVNHIHNEDSLAWVRERLADYPPTGAGR